MDKLVFIIDDDESMRNLYERAFRFNKINVVIASDGAEALAKLESGEIKPSAILLDVMMPKMSGFDVLKKLKENDKLKDIPVIVLSNLAQPSDVEKTKELGAALHLVKSQHEPQEIVDKALEVIGGASK
jgi:CheY-like chemotaxis protein